jgi:superfamily II DNA or RNA helicase
MTGHRASLRTHRIVVWVIDTARERLAADCGGLDVMLVVDECHRSGSGSNRRIYEARTRFRLGLSATANRQGEVDENGLLVPLEQQVHVRQLGPTVEPRITVSDGTPRS